MSTDRGQTKLSVDSHDDRGLLDSTTVSTEKSVTYAERIITWPDGHKIDRPTKKIGRNRRRQRLTVTQIITFLPHFLAVGRFWKCDRGFTCSIVLHSIVYLLKFI